MSTLNMISRAGICLSLVWSAASGERVLSENVVSLPNTLPGKEIRVKKIFDSKSHSIRLRCPGLGGGAVELEKLRKREVAHLKSRHGAVNGVLQAELLSMDEDDSVEVAITPKPHPMRQVDKTRHSLGECRLLSQNQLDLKPARSIRSIMGSVGAKPERTAGRESDRSIVCRLSRRDIERLKHSPEISSISKYVRPKPCAAPLISAARSAYNPAPLPLSAQGQGVRCATVETGIWGARWAPELNDTVFHFRDRGNLIAENIDINDGATEHSQVCFSMLWHTAPKAQFYHRHGTWNYFGLSYGDEVPVSIIRDEIQTLSNSYTYYGNCNGNHMLLVDDFAYTYPYPVFCNPAANFGDKGTVNWPCYNAISVGSFQHENQTHYTCASHSSWKNPPPVYFTVPDREMPYLLATGKWPFVDQSYPRDPDCPDDVAWAYEGALKTSYCSGWQGTSLAAPTTSGIAACVISARSSFVSWPEKVRAALILTAQNCDGGNWNSAIDGKDGTGAISGRAAVAFAKNCVEVSPGGKAVRTGLCAGSWYSDDDSFRKFKIRIPRSKPSGKHLRVVLTWNSRPDLENGINYLTDLDLSCVTPRGKNYFSSSYEGNVEVIDIPRKALPAGKTVEVVISPITLRFPPDPEKNWFYYAIGWTWVKNHAR